MRDFAIPVGLFLLAYGLGSVPFGLLLTKFFGFGDLRQIGSGNIGATNVLRTGHKGLAAATLLGDMLKGTLAVWLVRKQMGDSGAILAACGAFLGHLFPVWLRFKGGKGVATFLGCLIGLNPVAAIFFALFWLAVAFFTRYSSLAALVASALMSPTLLLLAEPALSVLSLALSALLWWKHKENILRLASGTETRIGS
jgi:acyl phosphate:glycerol-3-phosphate acyltransferase